MRILLIVNSPIVAIKPNQHSYSVTDEKQFELWKHQRFGVFSLKMSYCCDSFSSSS